MPIFRQHPIRATLHFTPDGQHREVLEGPSSQDADALGLLLLGFIVKLYWDMAGEPPVVRMGMLGALHALATLENLDPDGLLSRLDVVRVWLEGPPQERVKGREAKYVAKLNRRGSVDTRPPRNLAYLHAVSFCTLTHAVALRLSPKDRERLLVALDALNTYLASGAAESPTVGTLLSATDFARDAWADSLPGARRNAGEELLDLEDVDEAELVVRAYALAVSEGLEEVGGPVLRESRLPFSRERVIRAFRTLAPIANPEAVSLMRRTYGQLAYFLPDEEAESLLEGRTHWDLKTADAERRRTLRNVAAAAIEREKALGHEFDTWLT